MKRWAVLFGIVIVAIVVLADTRHLGFLSPLYDFPYGDKAGHFALFGLFSLLVNLAALEAWPGQRRLPLVFRTSLILAVLIGLEELSQRWFASRSSSLWDLAASYLGVALAAWLALFLSARQKSPAS